MKYMCLLLLFAPCLSQAGCNFVEIDLFDEIKQGAVEWNGSLYRGEVTEFVAASDHYSVSWGLYDDISSVLTVSDENEAAVCKTSINGMYFSEPAYDVKDENVFVIQHGIGSSYGLEFYSTRSCELLGKADVSTGISFYPSIEKAEYLIDKGYCKCENRENFCIGESSYCFPGSVYKLDDQCIPNSQKDAEATAHYNKSTYGVDFTGWTHIERARTENAEVRE